MQQIKSALFRHCSEKMIQNIFYSWFIILAFITRTFTFFMFTLVFFFFNQIYLSLHFDKCPWQTELRMINLGMRHLFYSIRNPKLETKGANTSSIKPLPSCTRTRLFVFLSVLYNLHPLATPTKIKCLPLNSFKKEYKLFLLDSLFCKRHLDWPGQVKHPYMAAISAYFLRR